MTGAEPAAAETATVGIAQWLPTPGEPERNEQTARAAVADLAARGGDLVVLPEMWLTGYDPGHLAEHSRRAAEPLDGPLVTRLRTWARDHSVMLCAGTIPELAGSDVYNTAVLIDSDGEVLTAHRKVHLYRPGGEDAAFGAGSSLESCRRPGSAGSASWSASTATSSKARGRWRWPARSW